MAYLAKLKIDGNDKEHILTNVQYHFHQGVDKNCKPNTAVFGGHVQFVVQSTDDTSFAEWMVAPDKQNGGEITFYDADGNKEIKKVKFEKAHCVNYSEVYDGNGAREHITIASKKVTIGNAEHENE